jgi:hypothetical protein
MSEESGDKRGLLVRWVERSEPDSELLHNEEWGARGKYARHLWDHINARRALLLFDAGVDRSDFDLACRLVDDVELRTRLAEISRRADFQTLREMYDDIQTEGMAAIEQMASQCELCGGQGSPRVFGAHARMMCDACHVEWMARPSTPPANGIRSALARARRAGLAATLSVEEWQSTVAYFEDRCAFCGGAWCLVEHATPIEQGGPTTVWNCLPACTVCNVNKANTAIEHLRGERTARALEWLKSKGRP